MGYFESTVPNDAGNTGPPFALRKIAGAGPNTEDIYVALAASVPDSTVGQKLVDVALQQIPTGLTDVVSGVDVAIEFLLIVNDTNSQGWVQVKSGDDNVIFSAKNIILPGVTFAIQLGGIKAVGGLKWQSSAGGFAGALRYYRA